MSQPDGREVFVCAICGECRNGDSLAIEESKKHGRDVCETCADELCEYSRCTGFVSAVLMIWERRDE